MAYPALRIFRCCEQRVLLVKQFTKEWHWNICFYEMKPGHSFQKFGTNKVHRSVLASCFSALWPHLLDGFDCQSLDNWPCGRL